MSDQAEFAYLVTATLFVLGLVRLRSPLTARSGNMLAAVGMVVAILTALISQHANNLAIILGAMVVGTIIGAAAARTVRMTAMPQMVALFNGMGAGAAALIAGGSLVQQLPVSGVLDRGTSIAAIASVIIGPISFTGSLLAFAKLQELMNSRPIVFPRQHMVNALLLLVVLVVGLLFLFVHALGPLLLICVLGALILGVLMVLPIGGGDMPVIISLLNSFTGIAAAATGFDVGNPVLIIGGTLVGASGTILTILMTRAMNRSLLNVLFGSFGTLALPSGTAASAPSVVRGISADDLAASLAYARLVIVVPGYGLAVARAQQEVREVSEILEKRGVTVKFAIHPVAGRMPGHMNVLLAEANVPYSQLHEMDEINGEFDHCDVALVVGANDVTNPAARNDPSSPLYGMPILNVDHAASIIVLKRSMNPGFAGIENPLFYNPKTLMLFGDARDSMLKILQALKEL